MQLGNSIRQGTSWLLTGSISRKIFEFFFGIALARLLIPNDFGLLVTVQIFTGVAGFIAGGGMGQALIQAKEVDKSHFQVVFTLQLLICSLIYAFFYFIAPWFANWFNTPIYTDLLRLSALTFLIRPFANISKAKLSREMRFKAIALISIIAQVIGSSLSIYLALHNNGVWSLLFGGLTATSFSMICFILVSKCYPRIHFNAQIAKTLGSYGFKTSFNDIIEYLRSQTPNFLIGKYLGPAAVGLFNKGNSLSMIPLSIIGGSAYQTVFRALSSTQDNLDQSKYIYLRTITLLTVYTFPFYIGMSWLAESFILTIYGTKWQMAAIPLQVFALSRLFACITNPSGAVIAAQNRLGTEIIIQGISLILSIAGCLPGIIQNDLFLIAIGLLPSAIFSSISLSSVALSILHANYKDLFTALKPALFLNTCLALALILNHYCLIVIGFTTIQTTYLLIQSIIGALLYAGLFLYFPIQQLDKEASRWKKKLKLPYA